MDEVLEMKRRDIERLQVVQSVLDRRIRQADAAELLKIGVRQVKRLCGRVRREGGKAVIHGLRGRVSNRQLDRSKLETAVNLLHHPDWHDFGPTFARDQLLERHGVVVSRESLRQWMIQLDLWQPWTRRLKHRGRRERKSCLGMLVQLDGSTHDWFEGRGPMCVLLIYIDDATSRILHAEFVRIEDTLTLMKTTLNYLRRWGRPGAFYVDHDSIYTTNTQGGIERRYRVEQPMTQFTRAMHELGIEVIAANSPQAKGRVERGFHTHQDRLVKELRLRGVSTMEAANEFLPSYIEKHNASYGVRASTPGDAHRRLPPPDQVSDALSLKIPRVIKNDFTIQYENRVLQLAGADQPVRVVPRGEVLVQTKLDGTMRLASQGRSLKFSELKSLPARRRPPKTAPSNARRTTRHPVKRFVPTFRSTRSRFLPTSNWLRE
jgi:transposase